ncbi:hypothetical protein Mesau_05958 [Mesorhizobium australicum WSM2073]|uniref:Uncharacterized protein n=2 Tax=Mesorhizobium TaxID=68287 RepID=L0KW13_MESAW|nr:hypothetical protein Mesci_5912 [Mesorhizobium ciceri biovar biserrulae WSM1271]AGB48179.1 hypothetical protein Mesau_05958 [Mesorhizobium australicum WSM2073]
MEAVVPRLVLQVSAEANWPVGRRVFEHILVDDAIETLPELVGRAEDTLRHYSVPERPAFVTRYRRHQL